MRQLFVLLTAVCVLSLAGCASKPKAPEWSLGQSGQYPRETHFIGVGIAKERYQAEDRARAQIAKVFEVQVQASERSSESFWTDRIGQIESGQYRQSAAVDLTTTTDRRLSGVRIAQTWYDERSRDYYVLAVLERLQLSRALRGQIDELDARVSARVGQAESSPSVIRQLSLYVQALSDLRARATPAADLAVVSPSGFVPPAPYLTSEIAGRVDALAGRLSIGVELEGDEQDIVKGAMVRALSRLSLSLNGAQDKDLVLRGEIRSEQYAGQSPWHWSHASAQVEFFSGEGAHLDSVRKTVREGSRIQNRADILAREKLGEDLAASLAEHLLSLGARQ